MYSTLCILGFREIPETFEEFVKPLFHLGFHEITNIYMARSRARARAIVLARDRSIARSRTRTRS